MQSGQVAEARRRTWRRVYKTGRARCPAPTAPPRPAPIASDKANGDFRGKKDTPNTRLFCHKLASLLKDRRPPGVQHQAKRRSATPEREFPVLLTTPPGGEVNFFRANARKTKKYPPKAQNTPKKHQFFQTTRVKKISNPHPPPRRMKPNNA